MIIDVHAHFLPKLLIERFEAEHAPFPGVELLREEKGVRFRFPGTEPTRPVAPKLSDLGDRKKWLEENGIDHQLVGGWMDVYGYELPPAEGLEALDLPAAEREAILGGTAKGVFRLRPDCGC